MSGSHWHVEVTDLLVTAQGPAGTPTPIVRDLSFGIARGEVLALIGESGSGKTTAGLSLLGYARPGCRIAGGCVRVGTTDVLALRRSQLADFRGANVSYIAQSAAAAFNPAQRLLSQVIEPALIHRLMPRREAEEKARELFRALALPDPVRIGERYPHQVSGGQLQRVMAAMALITDPELVVLDEPSTALDVTTQVEVLRAFKRVVRDLRTTALYISHDLAVVAQIADRIVVMHDGAAQETGTTGTILDDAQHPYTRSLLAAAAPRGVPETTDPPMPPLLEVTNLTAGYGHRRALIPVLHGVSFTIAPGRVLGVIGESGCGKSTLARVVAGLLPQASGQVLLDGQSLPARVEERTRDHLRAVQIVFQSADTALNPARRIGPILARPLRFYHGMRGITARRRVAELLDMVRLPRAVADRFPDELSGGQKQRINLARALAAEPRLLLCDEVTSALDTVVGAAVLDLLAELRRELGLAMMFISHDLSTVRAICDDIMILYAGQRVELGSRAALRQLPRHPYTDLLLSSVPQLRPGWLDEVGSVHLREASGEPSLDDGVRPCAFFRRCALRIEGVCDRATPPLRHLSKGGMILCHRDEAELSRVEACETVDLASDAPTIHGCE
ncbi:MAG: ABC transporter ATP-binding protein [Rhodospirillales bacterium]|nr:ABC transporter ATP-binding protein [Rhodospirillales bacterium]